MSILQHAAWPWLRDFIHIEIYGRDGQNGRVRIEVIMPHEMDRQAALRLTTGCVKCGRTIHPVRERTKGGRVIGGRMFFAATCELEHTTSCSRSKAASLEYTRICRDVRPELGR